MTYDWALRNRQVYARAFVFPQWARPPLPELPAEAARRLLPRSSYRSVPPPPPRPAEFSSRTHRLLPGGQLVRVGTLARWELERLMAEAERASRPSRRAVLRARRERRREARRTR